MKVHELKTLNKFFQLSWDDKKTYEIRYNLDRNFGVGDIVILQEIVDNEFTGRSIIAIILDVFKDNDYVIEDHVILQLKFISKTSQNEVVSICI